MPVYLDMNATTPVDPRVFKAMQPYFSDEFGNAGSRTHAFGVRAKQAVQKARKQVANVVTCEPEDVVFTSGATEANNIAILGLEQFGRTEKRFHIISTQIEHKAVLEPLEEMERRGFEVTLVPPERNGRINIKELASALRPDTLLVSMMHANNETGVLQPIAELAELLHDHPSFMHVDAAQTFGKLITPLQNQRIDLISVSAHKFFGPKGIGCLITRTRNYARPPLQPIMFGGGQERGLRPGTLPVPQIIGMGKASELAQAEEANRWKKYQKIKELALLELNDTQAVVNGSPEDTLPNVLNVYFPGYDSETLMIAAKSYLAISNGSACTSNNYKASHVLSAMGLTNDQANGSLRFSWSYDQNLENWPQTIKIFEYM